MVGFLIGTVKVIAVTTAIVVAPIPCAVVYTITKIVKNTD